MTNYAFTIKDLHFNGHTAALLSYEGGEPALWIRDEYLANKSDTEGTYTINDGILSEPISIDADLTEAIDEWARSADWPLDEATGHAVSLD